MEANALKFKSTRLLRLTRQASHSRLPHCAGSFSHVVNDERQVINRFYNEPIFSHFKLYTKAHELLASQTPLGLTSSAGYFYSGLLIGCKASGRINN